MQSIENIKVWSDARLLVVDIYKMFGDNKYYGFKDQIQRAAVSIMNNIAERRGYGSDTQFIKFLRIAQGNCYEVKRMLYLCSNLQYCTDSQRGL